MSSTSTYGVWDIVNSMNDDITNGLSQATNTINNATSSAISTQNTSLATATQQIASALQQSQNLQQPFATAGYNANDAYSASLGLSTTPGGSALNVQMNPLLQQLTAAGQPLGLSGGAAGSTATAPNLQTDISGIGQSQMASYLNGYGYNQGANAGGLPANVVAQLPQSVQQALLAAAAPGYNSALASGQANAAAYGNGAQFQTSSLNPYGISESSALGNSGVQQALQQYLGQQQYNTQNSAYQSELGTYNNLYNQANQSVTGAGFQNVGAYENALNSPATANQGGIAGAPAATSGLAQYANSPQAQLLYGANAQNMGNPATMFQNDAGTQMALQQQNNALNNQYAQKGLVQSGAESTGLSQNLYSNYNTYQNQLGTNFSNYQNQLAGLTQFGAGQTGSQNVYSAGTTNATNTLGTGQNVSTLQANQGQSIANAQLAAAAATSGNLFNGLNLQTQIQLNQAAANANAASSAGTAAGTAAASGGGGGSSGGSF